MLIIIINIDNYAWVVPAIENETSFFLKTAYPSRKHTKIYFPEVIPYQTLVSSILHQYVTGKLKEQ
ncbi:hypothetical protein EHQ68_09905 [Leptospira congkakensis]|uniref:Uncharacterized protein n=1 Tax=Leptospira congkakensis TaxID=2484932 RepID=A0A4Z1A418_9LEPT|nr:hypothetical protein EHQ68_09905 [Leptospira congkakensis]TGL95477.1 hypothetical protein EHQ69_02090 [Leptospira congkakensis]TGL96560.1 hypothetical protein EHQ70_09140 [Leptospira congkakensis]